MEKKPAAVLLPQILEKHKKYSLKLVYPKNFKTQNTMYMITSQPDWNLFELVDNIFKHYQSGNSFPTKELESWN